jgi:hypothetical protein
MVWENHMLGSEKGGALWIRKREGAIYFPTAPFSVPNNVWNHVSQQCDGKSVIASYSAKII